MKEIVTIDEAIKWLEDTDREFNFHELEIVTNTIKNYVGITKKRAFERRHKKVYEPMDTVDGKLSFVREYIENAFGRIAAKVYLFPEVWDGTELRWLIEDIFTEDSHLDDKRSGRHQRYRNHLNDLNV